ncbi:MAG: hypothetical protein KDI63_14105 [Gammaproteobacteria bacterium]|nr:hypothetical protein [Gammaproteobacteria bacterium]
MSDIDLYLLAGLIHQLKPKTDVFRTYLKISERLRDQEKPAENALFTQSKRAFEADVNAVSVACSNLEIGSSSETPESDRKPCHLLSKDKATKSSSKKRFACLLFQIIPLWACGRILPI